jgi:hypothetical protein
MPGESPLDDPWTQPGLAAITISHVRYTLVEKVTRVTGIACGIELRGKGLFTCGEDRHVDVGCTSGIRHRADCPEPVATLRVADGMPDALESRVDRAVARIMWMPVAAVDVALPDFDA